jgi:hypothetical protein
MPRKPKKTFLDVYKANFDTLKKACRNGDLGLLEAQDAKTGKTVACICAIYRDEEGEYNMVPLAKMFDGNPYEELNPPNPDGGFLTQRQVWGKDETP